jgi:hypothetical protein
VLFTTKAPAYERVPFMLESSRHRPLVREQLVPGGDVKIMLRTVRVMLARRGR